MLIFDAGISPFIKCSTNGQNLF
jgi:hypothetical protein